MLFTDLSDSTQLSGLMEAEAYACMLDEVRQLFRAAVEDFGGIVNQYQGDGLQALFGYPVSTEQDGCHAVEAALEVHRRVCALSGRFRSDGVDRPRVHSGIHAGLTLARPGGDVAGRIELFGAVPGIAKHLSDCADGDEILVSDETLGPAVHLFETCEHRQVQLKGRAEALLIRRVVARAAYPAPGGRGRRSKLPFIGRDSELGRLGGLLAQALAGTLQFGVVCASAGVGKTRLVEEFLHRVAPRGARVLCGYCSAELSAQPLQPVLHALRAGLQISPDAPAAQVVQATDSLLGELSQDLGSVRIDLVRALSAMSAAAGGESGTAESTARALRDLIFALAHRAPLVLFIDDWQWADDATRQLIFELRTSEALPMLLLVASRPALSGDPSLDAAEFIELAPFEKSEALRTVAELLPGVDPFVAEQIVRQAGGNPLFIEELCHFAGSVGGPEALQTMQRGPAWLETLIASRVARLPPGQRQVLDAAAVVGAHVPAWLLERLVSRAPEHPDIQALAEQDLLFPGEEAGVLRFKHGITRDVVYGAIGLQTRRMLHVRAAELLAAPGDDTAEALVCESLAYHCAGAGDYGRGARFATMAGDKAVASSSVDRAKTQYRAALGLLDRLPSSPQQYQQWRSVARRFGMVTVFDPVHADIPLFDRAIELARSYQDLAGEAFARYWLAYLSYALGDSKHAIAQAEAALLAAEAAQDQRLRFQVRTLQGQALAAAGEAAAARMLLAEAIPLMRTPPRAGGVAFPGLAYALACHAGVLGDCGLFGEAHAQFEVALGALPGPGHEVEGSVLCLRSNVKLWQRHWEEAAADARAAQRIAERVGSFYLFAMSRSLQGWADWQLGRGMSALKLLEEATAWLIARNKSLFISLNHGRLAEAALACGRREDARGHARAALLRRRERDPLGAAMALRVLARMAKTEGRRRRLLAMAERVAQMRESLHEQAANAQCRSELGLA